MKSTLRTYALFAGAAAVAVGAGIGLYAAGKHAGMKLAPTVAAKINASAKDSTKDATAQDAAPTAPTAGKKVLYWHDPMVPGQKFDKPGKSPFMDMQLVPVYADDANGAGAGVDMRGGGVAINPRVQQNLGIRTAPANVGSVFAKISAVGNVAYNEREQALVQARANGYLERLIVRTPYQTVRQGQALAELTIPDWVAAQEEYLAVKRMPGETALQDAARQRMRLAGMSEEQIRLVEKTGQPRARLTITAPVSGVVAELGAREGMTVAPGTPLFRINSLATVWIMAELPENQAAQVRPGMAVTAHSPALPGLAFRGKVDALLPEVNPTTRTVKARIQLANSEGKLLPGMFANVDLALPARRELLLVPSEAVIRTGKRSLVLVAQDDGHFKPVEVDTGVEADGKIEIRQGLQAGQQVVVSGQFLVDSEASLKATSARMDDAAVSQPAASGQGELR